MMETIKEISKMGGFVALQVVGFIGMFLYAVFLPETFYFMLGIFFDAWFPVLDSFLGYFIVGGLLLVPVVNALILLGLGIQSVIVLFKLVFTSYASFHGLVTAVPAILIVMAFALAYFSEEK